MAIASNVFILKGADVVYLLGMQQKMNSQISRCEITQTEDLLCRVRRLIGERVQRFAPLLKGGLRLTQLAPGKMLRTRFAMRLLGDEVNDEMAAAIERLCAAVEIVHTASLCHDDVIDNALIRRGLPALWRTSGASGAIIIGDLLLCAAMDLLFEVPRDGCVKRFVGKVSEVCAAEAEQEIALRGRSLDRKTCLRLARGKTGPLFAFLGWGCGGENSALACALEEVGYLIGTAYQVADDYLDAYGDESSSGKTLGTDAQRKKFTFARITGIDAYKTGETLHDLCDTSLKRLNDWPQIRERLASFLAYDLQAVFQCQTGLSVGFA